MAMILDKNKFYQWDLERTLEIVDNIVTEVHFKKFTDNRLYVCEVYDNNGVRVVDIPNILFTTPEKFTAYFYCNDLFTKQHISFDIIPRPKPTDYVYTETEVKRYDTLEQEIEELGNEVNKLNQKISEIPTIDENQLIGRKTEEGGVIIGDDDDNNKALAKDTFVNGSDNQAGYYGFRIDAIVGLHEENKQTINIKVLDIDNMKVTDYYAVNDIVQLDLNSHFYNRYKIAQISNVGGYTAINIAPLYGQYIIDDLSLSSDGDNWIYVVGKPYGELITHSAAASARGKNNIAIGAQSDVSGKNNIAIGDLSTVTGRDNKAGYAASAGGGYSEAMPSYSNVHGYNLKAGRNSQAVYGEFNVEDKDALLVIGNGTSDTSRNNAFTVGADGTAKVQSKLLIADVDVGSKLYESPYIQVDELPEQGDMDKIYITPEGQYIYGLKNKNTSTEEIEIWDGTTRTAPQLINGVYEITNGAELAYIVYGGGQEGAYYKLTKDIYLNDVTKVDWIRGTVENGYTVRKWFQNWSWSPTGGQTMATATAFKGTLDGNGHIIYGLYVNCNVNTYAASTAYGAALIPKADKNVVIKNLGIDNCYINSQYIASGFVATVNGGGTLSFDSCYVGDGAHFSGNNIGIFVGQPQNSGCAVIITNCCCNVFRFTDTPGNMGLYISTWGGITIKNCYSFTPFSTNETTTGVLIQNCYQTSTIGLKNGITYISKSNSSGLDVFTNPDKMPNLNPIPPSYIATESFPELIVFAYGWIKIENGVTKEYVDQVVGDAKYFAHTEIVETESRLVKANEELEHRIYQNTNDIASLQTKIEMPQLELTLRDEDNNRYRIFIKDGKLQMEVVE